MFQELCKQLYKKHVFKKFDIAMIALLERFGRPSWLILDCFGIQQRFKNPESLVPKLVLVSVVFWTRFRDKFGAHSGAKKLLKKIT